MRRTTAGLAGLLAVLFMLAHAAVAAGESEAVVRVPVASVYKGPNEKSERVTQVPLGDPVHILQTAGAWVRVIVPDQYRLAEGYPGWMHQAELETSQAGASDLPLARVARAPIRSAPDAAASILSVAYLGSRLTPTGKTQGLWMGVTLPGQKRTGWVLQSQVTSKPLPLNSGEDIVRTAQFLMGTPYVWGGVTAAGIDCSGLTFMVYRLYGIALPRDADQQFEVGASVAKANLEPGDLVFYGRDEGHITHVAIYKGQGQIIEASGAGGGVRISTVARRRDYRGARRVIGVSLTIPAPSP